MADNLTQNSVKSTDINKHSNVIHRTTSETLRLAEPDRVGSHPTTLLSSTPNARKKTSSFQITSVTGTRMSNDGGDDSADDLDESHTDDNSRITDFENETPSYSEDTSYSKEDVFFNASSAIGTAPVIPTSAQYGLVIVPSESLGAPREVGFSSETNSEVPDVQVSVTEGSSGSVINIVANPKQSETEMKDTNTNPTRNDRFKVVKIESTEPFKRGRWMCMDYLDHTTIPPAQGAVINVKDSGADSITTFTGPDSGVVLTEDNVNSDSPIKYVTNMNENNLYGNPVQNNYLVGHSAPNITSVSPGQTLHHISSGMTQHIPTTQMVYPNPNDAAYNTYNQMNSIPIVQQQQQLPQGMVQSQLPMMNNVQQSMPQQQQQQVNQHQSLPQHQLQQVINQANMQQLPIQQQISNQQPMSQNKAPNGNQGIVQPHYSQGQSMPAQFFNTVVQSQTNGHQPVQYMTQQSVPGPGQSNIQQLQGMQAQTQMDPQTMLGQSIQPQQLQQQQQLQQPQVQQQQQPQIQQQQPPQIQQQQQPQIQVIQQPQVQQQQPQIQQQQQPQIQQQAQLQPQQQAPIQQQVPQVQQQQQQPQIQVLQQQLPQVQQPQPQVQQPQPQIQQQQQQQQPQPQIQQQPQPQMQQQQQQAQIQPQQQIQQPQVLQQQQPTPQIQQQQPQVQQQQPQIQQQQSQPQGQQQQYQQQQQPVHTVPSNQAIPSHSMGQTVPAQAMPASVQSTGQAMPIQTIHAQSMPAQTMQGQTLPTQTLQGSSLSVEVMQGQSMPAQTMQGQSMPSNMQSPQIMQGQTSQPMQTQSMGQMMMPGSQDQGMMQQQLPTTQQQPTHYYVQQQQPQQPAQQSMGQMHQSLPHGAIQMQNQQPQPQQTMSIGHSVPMQTMQMPQQQTNMQIQQPQAGGSYSNNPAPQTVQGLVNQIATQLPLTVSASAVFSNPGQNYISPVNSAVITPIMSNLVNNSVSAVECFNTVDGHSGSATPAEPTGQEVEIPSGAEESSMHPAIIPTEEGDSASGTSAVAIDNKIEQAMDLVKSHLMFAVREEVEVLKERIAELMERINQLEVENNILKANASQETLSQLSTTSTSATNQTTSQQSSNPANGPVS